MGDNALLIEHVKNWLEIDKQIKALQKEISDRRKLKKITTETLVDIMKTRDIEVMNTSGGELIRTSRTIKSPLSKKHLLASLALYFKNDKKLINELSDYIMETRPEKVRENITCKKK